MKIIRAVSNCGVHTSPSSASKCTIFLMASYRARAQKITLPFLVMSEAEAEN
jgi:hypothetical protein